MVKVDLGMKEQDFEGLKEYIRQWNANYGLKACNEKTFIDGFLNLINNYPDDREVEFQGEGAYFGKQIQLLPFTYYGRTDGLLNFECAYSKTELRVYSANHNGFWYPEFLRIELGKDEYNIIGQFMDFLKLVYGL